MNLYIITLSIADVKHVDTEHILEFDGPKNHKICNDKRDA